MSQLLKSSQECKECGSRRGFAVYEDNEHCFSCGHHKNKLYKSSVLKFKNKWNGELPLASQPPMEYLHYVSRYGIETKTYYNDYYDSAIFPIRYKGEVKCYQARRIDGSEPKWVTISHNYRWGYKFPYIVKKKGNFILVEDIVSAMVLENYGHSVVSLLGCKVNMEMLMFILHEIGRVDKVVLWLDGDFAGRQAAKKLISHLKLICNVENIETEKDPKKYSKQEVENILSL